MQILHFIWLTLLEDYQQKSSSSKIGAIEHVAFFCFIPK